MGGFNGGENSGQKRPADTGGEEHQMITIHGETNRHSRHIRFEAWS